MSNAPVKAPIRPFLGPKLKIERAYSHLAEIERELAGFWKSHPYHFLIGKHQGANEISIMCMINSSTARFSCVVGDIIHNLRSALDHLASDLVAISGGNIKRAYFPTGKDVAGFKSATKNKIEDAGASPEAVAAIQRLETHATGNGAIRRLHDLDIIDKHSTIVTLASIHSIERLGARYGETYVALPNFKISSQGDVVTITVPVPTDIGIGDLKIDKDFQATPSIVFDKGQPFESESVIPTLRQLAQFIEEVVSGFAAKFGS